MKIIKHSQPKQEEEGGDLPHKRTPKETSKSIIQNLLTEVKVLISPDKMGHFAKDYRSKRRENFQKGKHHASTAEEEDLKKRSKGSPHERERRKEYYLVSALSGSLTTG